MWDNRRIATYRALAQTVIPMFASLRHPDDPTDTELMQAIVDSSRLEDLEDVQGALRRYAMRELARSGPGRPSKGYRDGAICYFVKAFRNHGMTKQEAIATIQDLLPVALSTEAIRTILRRG